MQRSSSYFQSLHFRLIMKSLLYLIAVSLWCQAAGQSVSLQFSLSVSTIPTNRRGSSLVTEGGSLKVCFAPTATPTAGSVIDVKTKNGTAEAPEDYTALDTNLTFTEADPQCVWFYPNLDVEDEGSETFTIQASGTSGDYSNVNIEVNVTINNQDIQDPSFSVEHDNYPATETAGEVEVCAAYYGTLPLASDATVQLRTVEVPFFPGQSPASAGSDYTPESGDLTFPAGSVSGTRRCITIKITEDNLDEPEETIQLLLTTQSGITLGPHTSATVRITEVNTVVPVTGDGDTGDGDNGNGDTGDGDTGDGDNGDGDTGDGDNINGEGNNIDGGSGEDNNSDGDTGDRENGGGGSGGSAGSTGGVCSTHNPSSLLSLLVLGFIVTVTVFNSQ